MAENSPAGQTLSQSSPRTRGPLVWLDMDQKELDDAYDQSVYAPNQQFITTRRRLASEAMLKRVTPERIAYGASEDEKLDIYKTSRPNAPINIFVHGGAWRNGQARDSAYLAEMFITAGAHFVIPDFVQVHNAGGNLMPMARQVRSAVAWVYKNAAAFRRRSESHLHHRAFLRRASRRMHSRHRLAERFRPACERYQGRPFGQWYVRFETGQTFEAKRIRQLYR